MDPSETNTSTIRKFNPGTFQTDEEVIRQFVVREPELNIVLDVLRNNIDSRSCQHILIVAPRGRGKTMLLARVAAELRSGDELGQYLLPVRFMEESQEVLDIADFWLETLFHLSREIVCRDPILARELRAVHTGLATRWRGEFLMERARAAVLDASDRLGRKLVLMVENLQTLCADVDEDFGWQLRETLQTEPQIILLGTATSRFERLDDVREPFFGFFRMLDLESLDTEACRRLWHMISGDEVTDRNIRPLEILTGGNPRLLVIVAEFARHRSFGKLMEELVTLVDDHTEYFRGHLETLAPTERRVYLAVIDLWQFSTANEIAARARMDIRKVSSLLGRLMDRGAVIVQGSGRKREYAAAERLFSIYYKLRRERDEASVVNNLIRFMTVFYSEDERAEVSDMPRLEKSEFLESGRLPNDLEATNDKSTFRDNVSAMAQMIRKASTQFQQKELSASIATFDGFIQRFGKFDDPKIRMHVATAMFFKAFTCIKNGEPLSAIAAYDDLIERFGIDSASDLQNLVVRAMGAKAEIQVKTGHAEEALRTCDETEKRLGSLAGNSTFPRRWMTSLAEGMRGRVLKVDSELSTIGWQLKWLRVIALSIQEKHQAATDELRSVYATFDPENEAMMHSILHNLIRIVVSGARVRDIIEILRSDERKAEAVKPLIIALYKRLDEKVRAPSEALEVADDIVAEMSKARSIHSCSEW